MSNIIKINGSNNYYARFMYDGKVHQKSLKTSNKRLAEKLAAQYYDEILSQTHQIGTNNISIKDAFLRYARTKPNDKNLQAGTKFVIGWLADKDIIDPTLNIYEMNTTIFEKMVEVRREEGRTEGTIKALMGHASRVVSWAKKNGFAVSDVDVPKIKNKAERLRYLSKDEEERLLDELDPMIQMPNSEYNFIMKCLQDNYDLCVLLLDTGARLTEITTLTWSNVNLKKETISLYRSKVGNEATLFMTKRVKDILKRRNEMKANEFVFNDSQGGSKTAVGGIRRAMKRAGLKDCTIHTLRHTAASRLVQSGMQLYEVSHILGHSDVSMTSRYAHLSKDDVSKRARDLLNSKDTKAPDHTSFKTIHLSSQPETLYNSLDNNAQEPSILDGLTGKKHINLDLSTNKK